MRSISVYDTRRRHDEQGQISTDLWEQAYGEKRDIQYT